MRLIHTMKLAAMCCAMLATSVVMGQNREAKEAEEAFKRGFYFNAIELYKKAYTVEKKASAKAELIFKVGECYRTLGDAAQAEVWYDKANKAQYSDPITYLYLGDALKEQGKYAEAIAAYNRFKEKKPGDARADQSITECQQAQKWKDDPTRYAVDPEVMLNTPNYDFSPSFADKNNNDLIFTSTRPAATGTETDGIVGESFSDLFTSRRDKLGKWSEPVKLPPSINTPSNEGSVVLNSKRTVMYFTRCPVEKKKVHGCDIWMTKKVGSEFSEPVMIALKPEQDKNDTNVITVGHPALTPDDGALIFSSNMKGAGSQGGKDLWIVKLDKDGKPVGKPTNLGASVNTRKDEMFPFVRFNGDLYLSSDGYPGMGGFDIFVAKKTGENTWGQVENMKAPLNSAGDDFGIVFDGEEDRGYFTTNRPGGKGQDDIWRFHMPSLIFALQGNVYDKVTGLPIPGASIEVMGTDGSSFTAVTDDNGGFKFIERAANDRFIKENTSYTIRAGAVEYLVVNDQATTVGLKESTTFVKEYFLQPARKDVIIRMPEVQYKLAEWTLTEQGKDSLEFLYNVMTENPTIIIELAAHTDTRDTEARNQILSENRAKSCVNYLVTKGIDPARMKPVGFGESKPRISDAEIAKMKTREEQEAAHQQNRRTEFRVLSFDYVPPQQPQTPNN